MAILLLMASLQNLYKRKLTASLRDNGISSINKHELSSPAGYLWCNPTIVIPTHPLSVTLVRLELQFNPISHISVQTL